MKKTLEEVVFRREEEKGEQKKFLGEQENILGELEKPGFEGK